MKIASKNAPARGAQTKTTRRFAKATIDDVAKRVGVSKVTISKFVNGREDCCSELTAERIRAAIAELHYVPGRTTRGLRNQATHTIGICIHAPQELQRESGYLPFFEELWRGLTLQADESDYQLLHYARSVRESAGCDAFLDGRIDGLILRSRDPRATKVARAGLPLTLLNTRDLPDGCAGSWVDEDDTVRLALQHLWARGHRRIAHLAGPDAAPDADATALWRREAYQSWMSERDLDNADWVKSGGPWHGDASLIAAALQAWRALDEPPTAVFCANDQLAFHLLRACEQIGWRVPDQLSVVGVDDSPRCQSCEPPLSSVQIPLQSVGREAVRALVELMNGADAANCRVAVPVTHLVQRQSVAPVS